MGDKSDIFYVISKMSNDSSASLFESALDYCEENDIDPEDLVVSLSSHSRSILKLDAVRSGYANKKLLGESDGVFS